MSREKTARTKPEVTIRPLQLNDAEAVQRYASDVRLARTTTIPEPYPPDGGETFVEKAVEAHANGKEFYFGILANGELVGALDFRSIDRADRSLECGYAIAVSHWGKGITTKALSLALCYAFCELDMDIVRSSCLSRNLASARVLEKNGFRETGEYASEIPKFKGEPFREFRLTKKEWLSNRPEDRSLGNSR
ncbi:MAG: GNAT family N-acetyltransferase [Candidatus Poribacteria bacterium]|nr:GNAT family N-acetyltransferase [Candidatus Poribacteria bacterium]